MGEPAIVTEELTRRFPSGTALDRLTIDVRPGEVLALLGPNGAGKTTTMRLLNGVLLPHGGRSLVLGHDPVTEGEVLRRRTGVLTENAGLDERFTALENLVFVARMRGIGEADARRRGGELLERFGMSDRADVKVQGFSTGQRKRVALARSLLHEPELLFLDEPTSGLDPAATRDVVHLIGALAAEQGRTVVLCTHFLGEAGKLAGRVAVLFRGHLHAFGAPADIADTLWDGTEVRIDLGAAADVATLGALGALGGVLSAAPTDQGAILRITERAVIPFAVALLVGRGLSVYAAEPHIPTLEDVYFAIEAQAAAVYTDGTGEMGRPSLPPSISASADGSAA